MITLGSSEGGNGFVDGSKVLMWIVKRYYGLGKTMNLARRGLDPGVQKCPEVTLYVARYPSIIVYPLCNNVASQSIAF